MEVRLFWFLLNLALAQDAATEPAEAEAQPAEQPAELIPGVQNAGLPPQAADQLKTLDQVSKPVSRVAEIEVIHGVAPMAKPIPTISGLPKPPPPIQKAGLPPPPPPLPMIHAELPQGAKVWINEEGKWLDEASDEEKAKALVEEASKATSKATSTSTDD